MDFYVRGTYLHTSQRITWWYAYYSQDRNRRTNSCGRGGDSENIKYLWFNWIIEYKFVYIENNQLISELNGGRCASVRRKKKTVDTRLLQCCDLQARFRPAAFLFVFIFEKIAKSDKLWRVLSECSFWDNNNTYLPGCTGANVSRQFSIFRFIYAEATVHRTGLFRNC